MKTSSSKSSLFIMELIIVVLFFSICAAICIQVFSTAQVISVRGKAITNGALNVQNMAEVYKASAGDFEETAEILGGTVENNTVAIYFNKQWEQTSKEESEYVILMEEIESSEAKITATSISTAEEYFALNVKHMGGAE